MAEDERPDFGIVIPAMLTLLGLVIGFSFLMAGSRYEQRKNYEEAEANAIDTEYVRANLLSASDVDKVHELLKSRLGIGVKDYRAIFLFENEKAFSEFLDSGWSGSAQADAAAKAGEKGGAYSGAFEVAPGVWVYQITKNGLALQLTLQGTK